MAQCSCSAENTKYQGVKNHFCAKLVVTPPGVRNKLSPIFKTSHLHEINLNQTLENLKNSKIQLGWRKLLMVIFYHDVIHFWWQLLPKITKMTTADLLFKIDTCNKHQVPLSLGQSSTWTCCQPFWMVAITKNLKSDYHDSMMGFGASLFISNGGATVVVEKVSFYFLYWMLS